MSEGGATAVNPVDQRKLMNLKADDSADPPS